MEKAKWETGAIMRTQGREEGAMELGAEPKSERGWYLRTSGGSSLQFTECWAHGGHYRNVLDQTIKIEGMNGPR